MNKPTLKNSQTFGTCSYERVSPDRTKINSKTQKVNIQINLEEALKLNLALNEGIRKIFRYDQRTIAGKQATINLIIDFTLKRAGIREGKLPKETKKKKHS